MVLDKETEFFLRKLELDYGDKEAGRKLKKISKEVSWLKGWPKERAAFWNGESFMWGNKISREKRELIKEEIKSFLGKEERKGRNLDLGCGSYSYISSVGLDIAERMLFLNNDLTERVVGDLEEELPFGKGEFDSVTMVFVLDYVRNYMDLVREAGRVLKKGGKLVVVQSAEKVNEWQRQKAVNRLSFKELKGRLELEGFRVSFSRKKWLGFFKGIKAGQE